MTDTINVPSSGKTFLGHPRGLVICFLTEMWERFSYYGMRGLLSLYLVQHFLFSDGEANLIYGGYIALVYIMSIVGGILSDKYLGQRKAVTFGALLLVAGHFGMAFEGSGSVESVAHNNTSYVIEDEGRDDKRQLFIDYEGQPRRIVFESTKFIELNNQRYISVDDYVIEKKRRGFVQNICNLVGLGCKGEDPSTTLLLGQSAYNVTNIAKDDAGIVYTADYNGQNLTFSEKSETDILILPTATKDQEPNTDNAIATMQHGQYSTSVEQQSLYVNILFFSLALIIAGVGFLKPNISTIVGDLYPKGDPRRDGGFTLFYMGINLGSFLATWTCGIIGITYGWAYGFGIAGIGMVLGLIVFRFGAHWLEGVAEPPSLSKLKEKVLGPINIEWACYLTSVLIVIASMTMLNYAKVIGPLAAFVGIAFFVGFIIYSFVKLEGRAQKRMWAALYFAVAQIPFWSLFEQAGSSLTLVTSRLVDKNIGGWNVPTPVFQSLNAGFIFIFAPLIAVMWVWLAKRNWEPSTPVKFALGVFGAGLGYLVLVAGMKSVGPSALTPVFFIFAIYWVHTMAELMLSPVGLSAMTKLAPARLVGLFMAGWFVYSGLGNALSGVIAAAAGADTVGGQIVDVAAAKENYIQVFSSIGFIGMAIGFVMLLISPLVKGWMLEDEVELAAQDAEAVKA